MSTLNQLKAFIVENWEWWPMELAGNDHVVWKDGWEHKKRNSAHSIKARVRNSLAYDAEQYGPFIADHKTLLTDADKFWFYDRELTVQERKERDQIDADAKKAQ